MKPSVFRPVLLLSLLLAFGAHAEGPRKIAFVDTGNTGRSVSAEALATRFIAEHGLQVAVISRAVDMDPFDVKPEANATQLLLERGLDVRAHVAAQMSANDAHHADLILTMTEKHKARVIETFPEAREKTFTLAEYASGSHQDVPDAWGKPMAVYVAMIHQLDELLPAALDKAAIR